MSCVRYYTFRLSMKCEKSFTRIIRDGSSQLLNEPVNSGHWCLYLLVIVEARSELPSSALFTSNLIWFEEVGCGGELGTAAAALAGLLTFLAAGNS